MVQKDDVYLIKTLLTASKKVITRLWYKTDPPAGEQWVCTVKEIFVMERLTHKLRLQETQFVRKWEKWTDFMRIAEETTVTIEC